MRFTAEIGFVAPPGLEPGPTEVERILRPIRSGNGMAPRRKTSKKARPGGSGSSVDSDGDGASASKTGPYPACSLCRASDPAPLYQLHTGPRDSVLCRRCRAVLP
jgi:hypothetical protein